MRNTLGNYGGILLGSLYGLIMRLLFSAQNWNPGRLTDLFSITFIWIVPLSIGIGALMFASNEQLKSNAFRISRPIFAVLLFFLICFVIRIEDIICILIIALPFLLGAALGGFIFGRFLLKYREKRGIVYSILLLPLVIGFFEAQIPSPSHTYEVQTAVMIQASPAGIWEKVVRVEQIHEEEYDKGLFNYGGIPRPLFAELDKDTLGAVRLGHFEGGLTFHEEVTEWKRNERVAFEIKVLPATIRNTILDQHILKGKPFSFLNASYELEESGDGYTQLLLTSSYQLNTQINAYGALWGWILLDDFQERLLEVIKKRCETEN